MSKHLSEVKRAARARRNDERRARWFRRSERWHCFWTWPFGHHYETPDGRGSFEVYGKASSGGARPDLRCVGCGKPFGLFEDDR